MKAFAHITGGGLLENIPRILPNNVSVQLEATSWNIPEVFPWLAAAGGVNEFEMLRTFNCGIGGVLIIKQEDSSEILKQLKPYKATAIGVVKKRSDSNGKTFY